MQWQPKIINFNFNATKEHIMEEKDIETPDCGSCCEQCGCGCVEPEKEE